MQRLAILIQIVRFVFDPKAPLLARIAGMFAIGYTLMPFTWGPLGILDNIVVPLLSLGLIQFLLNRNSSVRRSGEDTGLASKDLEDVIDADYHVVRDESDASR
jgi:hypothetical protein